MKYLLVIVALILSACGGFPPTLSEYQKNGVTFVVHTDDPTPPSECVYCSKGAIDGKWHIWTTALAPAYVIGHEEAHGYGMVHTEWVASFFRDEQCSVVLTGGGTYKAGYTICVNKQGRERTYVAF